jgi:hypothetical protein
VEVPTILDVASGEGRVLTMVEVDPATENPAVLDAIRYVHVRSSNRRLRSASTTSTAGDGEGCGLTLARLRLGGIDKAGILGCLGFIGFFERRDAMARGIVRGSCSVAWSS